MHPRIHAADTRSAAALRVDHLHTRVFSLAHYTLDQGNPLYQQQHLADWDLHTNLEPASCIPLAGEPPCTWPFQVLGCGALFAWQSAEQVKAPAESWYK